MTLHAWGDSLPAGAGASDPSRCFAQLLATSMGVSLVNHGYTSFMVMDAYDGIMGVPPTANDVHIFEFGTNDERWYNLDATKRGYFIDGLRYEIARMASVITPIASSMLTGSWTTGAPFGTYAANANGSKATFSFTGPNLIIGTLRQAANPTSLQVRIDGVVKTTFAVGGIVTTMYNRQYGPAAFGLTGLGAGLHTCEVTALNADPGNWCYLQYFSTGAPLGKACVINIPHALQYELNGNPAGSQANVDAYNVALAALVSELAGYGLNVALADVCSVLTTSDMFDEVHPNDSGHLKIANAASISLTGDQIYVPTQTFMRGDGKYFVGVGSTRKEIGTIAE